MFEMKPEIIWYEMINYNNLDQKRYLNIEQL